MGVLQHNRTDIFWSKSTYYIELIFSSFQRLLFRFKNLELGDLGRAQILKQIE